MMRCRMVEELGEREAKVVQSRPIQIAKNNMPVCFLLHQFEQACLRAKIAPALAVVDHSVDPGPKLWVHRLGKFLLPPKIKWQIRIQIREDDAWQLCGATPFEQERNLLGANLLAPD